MTTQHATTTSNTRRGDDSLPSRRGGVYPLARRGGVYPLVLIVSAAAATAALTGLAVRQATDERAATTTDLADARLAARSGIEAVLQVIDERNGWRNSIGTLAYTFDTAAVSVTVSDETDGDLSDDDTDPYTLTSTAVAGDATTTLRVTVTPTAESGYRDRVIAAGPIRYWPLDETSGYTADDLMDNDDAGHTNPANLGKETGFDGGPAPLYEDPAFYAWDSHTADLALDEGTVMCWVKCNGNIGGDQVIFAKSWREGSEGDFEIHLAGKNLDITAVITDDKGKDDELDLGQLTPGEWTHIAVAFGKQFCGFVNGVEVDKIGNCKTEWTSNNEFLYIGAIRPGILVSNQDSLNGSVRDVSIFDTQLKKKDIEDLIEDDGNAEIVDTIKPEDWAWVVN
jgi:hypothetical protein